MSNVVMLESLSRAMCALDRAKKSLEKALAAGGIAGKNIELQVSETHIQWRLVGDADWIDLIALSELQGDAGDNGKSAFELAQEDGYEGTITEWLLSLIGSKGDAGNDGQDGRSAFQIALDNGFSGTASDWLASLKGERGEQGSDGDDGADGKSAYHLALDAGFIGTLEQWLATLKGPQGDAGEDGEDGSNGKSAYQLALDNAFVGSESEWLLSLNGQDGEDGSTGQSAYEIAAANGFVGSEADWIASLKGQKGDNGADGITPGLHYLFNSTIGGIPGSNKFTVDNATLASITTVRLSIYRAVGSAHNGSIIYSWDDSTNPIKGQLRFTSKNYPDRFIEFNITGAISVGGSGEYTVIPVTYLGGSTFDNNETVVATFARSGNLGAAGTAGVAGDKGFRPLNAQLGTAYTVVIADQGLHVTLNNASPVTLTVPTNAAVAYPIGTEIDISQLGAGQVTFAGASGVTIRSFAGNLKLAGQYSAATLKKIATNEWLLVGNLSA